MSPNQRIALAFANQFTPPLNVCKSERINNIPMPDAWVINYYDNANAIGITTVVYGGQIHAFIEAAGIGDIAEHAGRVMAKALGLFQLTKALSGNLDPAACVHEAVAFRTEPKREWFCKGCGLAGNSTLFGITDPDGD